VLGGQPDQANAGCVASVLGAMRTRWAVPSVPLVNAAAATVTAVEALCAVGSRMMVSFLDDRWTGGGHRRSRS